MRRKGYRIPDVPQDGDLPGVEEVAEYWPQDRVTAFGKFAGWSLAAMYPGGAGRFDQQTVGYIARRIVARMGRFHQQLRMVDVEDMTQRAIALDLSYDAHPRSKAGRAIREWQGARRKQPKRTGVLPTNRPMGDDAAQPHRWAARLAARAWSEYTSLISGDKAGRRAPLSWEDIVDGLSDGTPEALMVEATLCEGVAREYRRETYWCHLRGLCFQGSPTLAGRVFAALDDGLMPDRADCRKLAWILRDKGIDPPERQQRPVTGERLVDTVLDGAGLRLQPSATRELSPAPNLTGYRDGPCRTVKAARMPRWILDWGSESEGAASEGLAVAAG